MTTEAEAFDEFDEQLKLDPAEREAAKDCHHEIGDILDEEDYTVGRFLQGSFRRKTMIKPLRDIDMVVLLHPDLRRHLGEAVEPGRHAGVAGGPRRVMELLEAALRPHYLEATFEIGKHALTIDFGDESFKFDAVPAFDTDGGPRSDVLIANTETGQWQRSNTRELIATVQDRNGECNGRFIHQVRMIKHAVKHNPSIGEDFFGLLSESITFAAVADSLPHAQACLQAFTVGAELLDGEVIFEPTGEDNLLAKLDPGVQRAAQQQFDRWRQMATEARELADRGDDAAAIEIWHRIFTEGFPSPAEQTTEEAARAWQGGAATSTGRVSDARTSRAAAPPGRSWRSH